jgi:hypothetical protein
MRRKQTPGSISSETYFPFQGATADERVPSLQTPINHDALTLCRRQVLCLFQPRRRARYTELRKGSNALHPEMTQHDNATWKNGGKRAWHWQSITAASPLPLCAPDASVTNSIMSPARRLKVNRRATCTLPTAPETGRGGGGTVTHFGVLTDASPTLSPPSSAITSLLEYSPRKRQL